MRCPKCDHSQSSTVECEACGLIFARYKAVQERRRKAAQENLREKHSGSGLKISSVAVLVLVTVAATYFFTSRKTETHSVVQPSVSSSAPALPPTQATKVSSPKTSSNSRTAPARHGLSIADAGQATVSIETPFGSGSGFFIRDEWIVTNRHVIEMDSVKVKKAKKEFKKAKRYADLEEQKLRGYRKKLHTIPDGPAKSQLVMIIEQKEQELSDALIKLQRIEDQLNRLDQPILASDIKIILADGNEYFADYLLTSDNYDLAILSLFAGSHKVLQPGQKSLAQGDKVYTIGSPVGLRQTVTSGIFSGYRKRENDDRVLLQTDAPINPGNSGGPLINEQGYVYGINTSIIANTEGIGFAIPINAVYTEFASAIQ